MNLDIEGTPSGVDTIEVRPASDEVIFNEEGLSTSIEQTTGEVEFFETQG